ncbi:GNAT family N-acetyltransferase [Shewanella decolorationis]|uniref:GNAT family N-acetyltransferase n=2 Tax=Shewanella decolorationis TaxID=256839 RepID=A0A5B8QV07_9GAMM|nr:GNAT family N-acetyltransferase [Shewanella decolorationis]ESE41884.1 GCN5-related N-acetyltransferase [Shewanella decolorationis S12]QDZ90284.1 GNAT family N-acetyltransferase [Shewanella decolorationis]GLR32087.1 N-acetyltransferase [Shewanella decolorationis]
MSVPLQAKKQIEVIPYQRSYARAVSELFHYCVRQIQHERYNAAQLNAWSQAPRSSQHWHLRLSRSQAWIILVTDAASLSKICVGFINVETDFHHKGYIDSLYIHPDWQRQGLGERAYRQLELWAREQGYSQLSADASYLSRGLFIKLGFVQQQRSYQQKLGQVLPSFYMTKKL